MDKKIIQQQVTVDLGDSTVTLVGNLIVSLVNIEAGEATVIVGTPGLPNVNKIMTLGDAVLFQTPSDGMLEVRALSITPYKLKVLVTRVSPALGFSGGLSVDDPNNSPFQKDEIEELKRNAAAIYKALESNSAVTSEQLDAISRTLNEITEASKRLGRKDWIMFVAGNLSNLAIGLALQPDVAKSLFLLAQSHFGWVFNNAIRLLLS